MLAFEILLAHLLRHSEDHETPAGERAILERTIADSTVVDQVRVRFCEHWPHRVAGHLMRALDDRQPPHREALINYLWEYKREILTLCERSLKLS